jgi:heme/copper-type cytochrome/quinol oxidase subunit 2
MDLISILATVILATTIGTVMIGVAAYVAFKLRDKRKPKTKVVEGEGGLPQSVTYEPIFLSRYVPEPTSINDGGKQ